MKRVEFVKAEPRLILSENTGQTEFDKATGTMRKVYRDTYEKDVVTSRPSIIEPLENGNIIYPGALLQGSSFLQNSYNVLPIDTNKLKHVTLSLSLRGEGKYDGECYPVLSRVRRTLNTLLVLNKDNINPNYIPNNFSFSSDSITHEESFSKSFSSHIDLNVALGLVKTEFAYKQSSATVKQQTHIMVKLTQQIYSASIDPKAYEDWFKTEVKLDFGTHEPLYVSNIVYGRVAYFLLETNLSKEESEKMLKASVKVALKVVEGGTDIEYNEKFKRLFADKKVRVKVIGGPIEDKNGGTTLQKISSYAEFMDFLQNTSTERLIESAAAISYTVSRLIDNTTVEVVIPYKESIITLKD